jgi:ABC-type transport system involved in multi-copper enzyme maturation permease subunit
MWTEFFRFDLRYQLRQPLLWIVTLALVLIAFLTAGTSVRIGGPIGNAFLNAPSVIAHQLGVLSMVALFLVTALVAGAVLRDSDSGIADLLYATPMRKRDYLGGRFLAGVCACVVIFVLVTLAMAGGSLMPYVDPNRIAPFSAAPYLWSLAVLVLPNLLFVASLLMLLAATTRSLVMVYVGVLVFLTLWAAAGLLGGSSSPLAVLFDPFGLRALAQATRYYTNAERNTRLPELGGMLLANRVLWTVLALALLATTVALFKPQRAGTSSGRARRAPQAKPDTLAPPALAPRRDAVRTGGASDWARCWSMLCLDTRSILRSTPFLIMLLLGLVNFVVNVFAGGVRFDSRPYPLTYLMLEELAGGLNVVLPLVLLFFSAELVHKDRQSRMDGLVGALPVPSWAPLLARVGALFAIVACFLLAGVPVAIALQLLKGGAAIEPLLYLQGTAIDAVPYALMAMGLLAAHTAVRNKYLGHLLGLALICSAPLLWALGIDDRLLRFASLPTLQYSDLNGYGHYLPGWSWFAVYWLAFAALLLVLAQGRRGRMAGMLLAAWAGSGAWIYYNTHVLNRFESRAAQLDARADYEKRYGQTRYLPHPEITAMRTEVDIHPRQQAADIRGHYLLKNTGTAPISLLRIQNDPAVETRITALAPHKVLREDARLGVRELQLAQPLAPGATMAFGFTVRVRRQGFSNDGAPTLVNENGTVFSIEDLFPRFGYNASLEIGDPAERRSRGLKQQERMADAGNRAAQGQSYLAMYGFSGALADFETVVSTSGDQTAMAPGDLLRSWERDGRRYFHYRMARPALPFFAWQSGRWAVRETHWRGVAVRVFHDPKHAWNVERMLAGATAALDYQARKVGPYPHKELRILEIPRYQSHARSYPMTIPFSESLGFVNDMRDREGVDHVFYVTAHEVAHQWWGDQVIAANVAGAGLITETLAEYTALMALRERDGDAAVARILRFDLDEYLRGRGVAGTPEVPLARVGNESWLQYRKGSLAMVRLQHAIGEAALNQALRSLFADTRYRTAPFVTSAELLARLRQVTPAEKQALLADLFERVVVYDNRPLAATATRRADGRWDLLVKLQLRKQELDARGREATREYDEPVEVAVEGEGGTTVHRVLPGAAPALRLTLDKRPAAVQLDPAGLLTDRDAADNRMAVTVP